MEQLDLLVSKTMNHNFPEIALQGVVCLAVAFKRTTLKRTKEPKAKEQMRVHINSTK